MNFMDNLKCKQNHQTNVETNSNAYEYVRKRFKNLVCPEFFSAGQQKILYQFAFGKREEEHPKTYHARITGYEAVIDKNEIKDHLPFRGLGDYMAVEGLSIKDIYLMFGKEIDSVRPEINVIIDYCSLLSENGKEELLKNLTLMTPTWWRELEIVLAKPSYRVYTAYHNKRIIHDLDEDALKSHPEFIKIENNRWFSRNSDFLAYPDFARILNLSLRWLLKDIPYVYTRDEKIESIIDTFYFLRPELRELTLKLFKKKLEEKKGASL